MNNLHAQRVVVVGATGFIGSHLVDRLVAERVPVLAIARSEIRRENLEGATGGYEFAACDIAASPDMVDIFARFKPTIVYHLAAKPDAAETQEHIEASLKVNAFGTLKVLEAAQQVGVSRVVYGGTSKIFGHHQVPSNAKTPSNPLSSYAIGKSTAWQLCKLFSTLYKMETVCLHPAFVYGPRQNWNLIRYIERCVHRGEVVRLQGGGQTRDPLYVGDVVDAYLAAGIRPGVNGEAVPVGGGVEVTVSQLARKILEALGMPDAPIEIGGEQPRPTEIWRNYTDNRDAERLLGWRPRTSLDQGLRLTVHPELLEAVTTRATGMGNSQ
jgi:nucleoside-diphosphate-sugar epimerase